MIRPLIDVPRFAICAALLCGGHLLCAQGVAIHTEGLPWAIKGEPYHAPVLTRVSGRCPRGDVGLSVVEGELPRGVELFSFGLEGTPLQMGAYQFTLEASNGCGAVRRRMQLLVTGRPILLVTPARVAFRLPAGASAAGAGDILKVEASWPELPYSVTVLDSAPWLSVTPAEGKTPDPDSAFTGDRVQVRVNADGLAPGLYHATLKFYAEGSENAPRVDVTLQVSKPE